MRRAWRWVASIAILVPVLGVGNLAYVARRDQAVPTSEALAALEPTSAVKIEFDDWLVMRPAGRAVTKGLILYPGANCDVRGYAPVLREIAAAGYLVVAVPMPFNRAVLAPNRADAVRKAFPEIKEWVLTGHSLGGAMVARYAARHPNDIAGLILLDSRPPEANSLAAVPFPVVHIHRASLAGEAPATFTDNRHLFPADSRWVPIRGGIHMYFGSFDGGGYKEVWTPQISRAEHQRQEIAAMLAAMASMT